LYPQKFHEKTKFILFLAIVYNKLGF
jgi:hypothetical protein